MKKVLMTLACSAIMLVSQSNSSELQHLYVHKIGNDLAEKLTIKDKRYVSSIETIKDFIMLNKIVFKISIEERAFDVTGKINHSVKYILAEDYSLDREDPEFNLKLPIKYKVSEILNFENIKDAMTGGLSFTVLDKCEEYFRKNDGEKLGWAFYMYDYKNGKQGQNICTVGVPNFELKKLEI